MRASTATTATHKIAAPTEPRRLLRRAFDGLHRDALLEHFRTRRGVACYPVLDADAARREWVDAVVSNDFCFNGECHHLGPSIDWSANPSGDVEWHVLLHKFYYAPGLATAYRESAQRCYLDKWVELTDSWMDSATPDFVASPGLRPEVTQVMGRRLQNWIYAWHLFMEAAQDGALPPAFVSRWLESVHQQVEFLKCHLSPARNHRTLELYAIFLAAVVLPEFESADEWRRFSLAELSANLQSDLLDDGVHCELSTHYHHLVVQSHLHVHRLALANDIELPPTDGPLLERALEFVMHIHKPDGFAPSLSDADHESHLHLLQQGCELFARDDMRFVATAGAKGHPPAQRCVAFDDAGYYVMRSGWGDRGTDYSDERYLVFDCGPIGAGNHGHLDCLSFEAAAFGHSLVVDPGRYTYDEAGDDRGETNWRAWFRGTAAHNTVSVDGLEQARYERRPGKRKRKIYPPEPWHTFHGQASLPDVDVVHGSVISAEYDAIHERAIYFVGGEYWVIFDALHAASEHRYDLRLHLSEMAHGKITQAHDVHACTFHSPHMMVTHTGSSIASVDDGFVAHRYGDKRDAPVLRFAAHGTDVNLITVLFPFDAVAPKVRLEMLPVVERNTERARTDCLGVKVTSEWDGRKRADVGLFVPSATPPGARIGGLETDGRYLWARGAGRAGEDG